MFAEMNKQAPSTCFLNEQSRMAEPICDVVSNCFYDGKLVVADDAEADARWRAERRLVSLPGIGDDAIFLDTIAAEGTWSQKYRGPIRFKSAERVRDIVAALVRHVEESDILILTPFRAQRTLIRTFVERAGCKRVKVSTVHRAQGSERHTVIFDPTQGNNNFLHTDDARRLVNVALSRAKARLVVLISPGDRENPLFDQIATKLEKKDVAVTAGIPIARLIALGNFPSNALGTVIQLNGMAGEIIEVLQEGKKFKFRDYNSGSVRTFLTTAVIAGAKANR
jgi:superfamily I DNA and/or RNA helicase